MPPTSHHPVCRRHQTDAHRQGEPPSGLVGQRVRLAAWLVTGKVVHTRHGDPMEFLTFEDETGIVETTFFPSPIAASAT
jgi:DNA polymerase III alpha subunit